MRSDCKPTIHSLEARTLLLHHPRERRGSRGETKKTARTKSTRRQLVVSLWLSVPGFPGMLVALKKMFLVGKENALILRIRFRLNISRLAETVHATSIFVASRLHVFPLDSQTTPKHTRSSLNNTNSLRVKKKWSVSSKILSWLEAVWNEAKKRDWHIETGRILCL